MADQNKKQSGGFNPIGLCLGMGIGLCFGTAMDNMALGLCLGMGVDTGHRILVDVAGAAPLVDDACPDEQLPHAVANVGQLQRVEHPRAGFLHRR